MNKEDRKRDERIRDEIIKELGLGRITSDDGTIFGTVNFSGGVTLAEKVDAILDRLGLEVAQGPKTIIRKKEVRP